MTCLICGIFHPLGTFFFSVRPSTFLVIFYIKYTCVNSLKNLRQQNVVILIKAFDGLSLSLEVSQLVQDVT